MPAKDVGETNGRSIDRLLGEMIAEIRGVKHATNNLAQQVEAIGPIAATAKEALKMATEAKESLALHHTRIAVLEADKNRRDGAIGLVAWLGRNWPVAFFSALLAAWVAWVNNKVPL